MSLFGRFTSTKSPIRQTGHFLSDVLRRTGEAVGGIAASSTWSSSSAEEGEEEGNTIAWVYLLAFRGIFLPEKRVLQDVICCPSVVNKCPFKRTYYSIFGKECLIFVINIRCPFRINC